MHRFPTPDGIRTVLLLQMDASAGGFIQSFFAP